MRASVSGMLVIHPVLLVLAMGVMRYCANVQSACLYCYELVNDCDNMVVVNLWR